MTQEYVTCEKGDGHLFRKEVTIVRYVTKPASTARDTRGNEEGSKRSRKGIWSKEGERGRG